MDFFQIIAEDLKIEKAQVLNTIELLDNAATVPFIARYRKEKTGSLDEEVIRKIQEQNIYFKELEVRKQAILKSIKSQDKLTPALEEEILQSKEKNRLEDLYIPFKPKRKTRASSARDAGLDKLAVLLSKQPPGFNPYQAAEAFIKPETAFDTQEKALAGAVDILAEDLAETPSIRNFLRKKEELKAVLISQVKEKHKNKKTKFDTYCDFRECISKIPSHRILAIRRGEKEGVLRTEIVFDDEKNIEYLRGVVLSNNSDVGNYLTQMVEDSYNRLLKPSIENEIRANLKKRADKEAYLVFTRNLKEVLLSPPAGSKIVLGVDPGFKSGTKLAVVDQTGKFLEHRTIYPLPPQKEVDASKTILLAMVERFNVEIIAIGNGTASREADDFIKACLKELETPPISVVVNESGASVYSASTVARQEFPDLDVTIRGAISIARRIQDPLSELVKIDPKSIGVGQYQHDVNQLELKRRLEEVVESCVNSVGIDINTASYSLLKYISGINKVLAKNIEDYRKKVGAFTSRSSLVKVPGLGPKAFEQAAGFLRVFTSDNPLDASAVHPERYDLVNKISNDIGVSIKDLIGNKEKLESLSMEKYADSEVGVPTLLDIKSELLKPNRDPRKRFVYASFNPKIREIKDLKEGEWVEGVVTNVTDFGIFVDVGVHQDGLVHISEASDSYVSDLSSIATAGNIVKARILSADPERKKISLSMKTSITADNKKTAEKRKPKIKKPPLATVGQLKKKFNDDAHKKQNNIKLKFSLKSIMKSGR